MNATQETNSLIKEITLIEDNIAQLMSEIQQKEGELREFESKFNLLLNQPDLQPRENNSTFDKLQILIENEPSQQEREKKIKLAREAIALQKIEITQIRQELANLQVLASKKRGELHWQENYAPHVGRLNAEDKSREYIQQFIDTEACMLDFLEAQQRYINAIKKLHVQAKGKKLIFDRSDPLMIRYPAFVVELKAGLYKISEARINQSF